MLFSRLSFLLLLLLLCFFFSTERLREDEELCTYIYVDLCFCVRNSYVLHVFMPSDACSFLTKIRIHFRVNMLSSYPHSSSVRDRDDPLTPLSLTLSGLFESACVCCKCASCKSLYTSACMYKPCLYMHPCIKT